MYKHVAKQQRLNARNVEAHLSDEDSSGDEEEEEQEHQPQLAPSDSESGSESGSDEEEMDEDQDEEQDEDAPDDTPALAPPPPGFPTAQLALENPIVDLAVASATGEEQLAVQDQEESPLLCVVCPTKTLKQGKMLQVHLGSKDHKRRFTRFRAHITDPKFPSSDLAMDARSVSAQLDALVLARLSLQTQLGGTAPSATPAATATTTTLAPTEVEAQAAQGLTEAEQLKLEAEREGISKRQLLREKKHQKVASQRMAKKEKKERLKLRAEKKGEPLPAPTKPIKRKPTYVAPKPTKEEIAARQALKIAKREAQALAALKNDNVPKDVVELKKEGKVDSHGEKTVPKLESTPIKMASSISTPSKSKSTPIKSTPTSTTPKSINNNPTTAIGSTPSTTTKRKRSAPSVTTPALGSAKKEGTTNGSAQKKSKKVKV